MQDMTSGKPLHLIIKFAIPLLISNFFQQFYSVSDIILVGHLVGVKALAAVGTAAPLFFFLVVVSIGFTNGLSVITAQSFGAGNYQKMRRSVATSIILGVSFTLLFGLAMFLLMDNMLEIMNVPLDIRGDTKAFMNVICAGVVMIVGFNLLSGFMRALGDSKTPLYFLIFTTLVNILLNVFFIYFCRMGIKGSALGTVTAMSISVVSCLIYMNKKFEILKPHRNDWHLSSKLCIEHLIVAVPMAIQFSIIALSSAVTQTICNKFGFETIAAMTAALRIDQLASQPMVSLGIGISTYVAQNYGAKRITRIRRGVLESSIVSFLMSIILAIFVFGCGRYVVGFFIPKDQPEVVDAIIDMSQTYLNISIVFYFFLGQIFIFRNACQGMGNSMIPMFSSVVELLMRIFASIYLAQVFGFVGLCYANPLAWIGCTVVVSIGYFQLVRQMNRKLQQKRNIGQKTVNISQ